MTIKTLHWTPPSTLITGDSAAPVAEVFNGDIMTLAQHWPENLTTPTLIVPCGQHKKDDPEPSADLMAQWSQESWEPFNAAVEELLEIATTKNIQLVILPGAGGRLSDAICTLSWATTHPEIPLLIDPVRWLTPSMMSDLTDHLIRSASLCEELPNIWGVAIGSTTNDPNGLPPLITPDLINRTIRTISTPRMIECK